MLAAPWDYLLSHYNFMILYTAYHRNITFYSNMDLGQLRTMYAQLVSYSPARVLLIDSLVSAYKAQHCTADELAGPGVPYTLSSAVTLALGNGVPSRFIHACIAKCDFKTYDRMTLAAFAAVEGIRGGALKYMAVLEGQSGSGRCDLHTVVATAVAAWMAKLAGLQCSCGTWAQVLDAVSCNTADTETSLRLQSESKVSDYICTLLELPVIVEPQGSRAAGDGVDYEYMFDSLLVSDLFSA